MTTDVNDRLPVPLNLLGKVKDSIMGEGFLGGPSVMKMATLINIFKAGTLPYCLWLMQGGADGEPNYSETMLTYTALHGSYGLVWLLKEAVAPDRGWQKDITIPTVVAASVFPLGAYWVAPWLLAKKKKQVSRSRRLLASITFTLGVAIMFGSDIQKHFVLKERPGLITDGFFGICRHPNYLGEIMIYGSFASLVADSWVPWAILGSVWGAVFSTQMLQKEVRMSRHAGWEQYQAKVAFIIPYIF